MFIVIFGDPVSGFSFTGPFPDSQSAIEFAEYAGDGDWWISDLDSPVQDDAA